MKEFRNQLGQALALYESGDMQAAQECCEDLLSQVPQLTVALNLLGGILIQRADFDGAVETLTKAVSLDPNHADAFFNLGLAQIKKRDFKQARAAIERGLQINPEHFSGNLNLGFLLLEMNDAQAALPFCEKAKTLHPQDATANFNYGMALLKSERVEDATRHFHALLEKDPEHANSYSALGLCYLRSSRRDRARESLETAVLKDPLSGWAWNNLGILNSLEARFDEALENWKHSISLDPNSAQTHLNLAMEHLRRGEFETGWKEYAWRGHCRNDLQFGNLWDGKECDAIVLESEQGLGDSIQFIRYAVLVKQRVKKVIVRCQPALASLFKTVAGVDQVLTEQGPIPEASFRIPFLSLPEMFRTRIDSIPAQVPYLHPKAKIPSEAQARIETSRGLKVGIWWQGNPNFSYDCYRSIPAHYFAELAAVPGIEFFSLQQYDDPRQLTSLQSRLSVHDMRPYLTDFETTATIVQKMDLLIGSDTALAHLAGALGKPIWVLASKAPDWRWSNSGKQNPWYPSLRVIYQKELGNWSGVMQEAKKALSQVLPQNPR